MGTFKTFYIDTKDRLFAYLIRMTGDYQLSSDVLQESFVRLLSHYGPDERSVSLLYKIARNALTDCRRRSQREITEVHEVVDERNVENDYAIKESYQKVLDAMMRLDETEREILSLSVTTDFSYRDIAGITGISETNVRVRIHRARLKLKTMLHMGKGETLP